MSAEFALSRQAWAPAHSSGGGPFDLAAGRPTNDPSMPRMSDGKPAQMPVSPPSVDSRHVDKEYKLVVRVVMPVTNSDAISDWSAERRYLSKRVDEF